MRQKEIIFLKKIATLIIVIFSIFLELSFFSEKFMTNCSDFLGVGHGGERSFILEVLFAKILRNFTLVS